MTQSVPVRAAYKKMRKVWASQKADYILVTKLWDAGHEFTLEMQNESFTWLEKALSGKKNIQRFCNIIIKTKLPFCVEPVFCALARLRKKHGHLTVFSLILAAGS